MVYDIGAMHLEAKSNGMHTQESRKELKRTLMASSKKSEAQGQVWNHDTFISSLFRSYFFLIFITLS